MATTPYNLMESGAVDNWKCVEVSLTNDATTTAQIAVGPYVLAGLANESGGSLAFTLKTAVTGTGTALTPYDVDSFAVPAITVGDDCYQELSTALAAAPYLIVYANAAADNITLCFKKQG